MHFFDIFALILSILFVFLFGWLVPKTGKTHDIFKMQLDLFPVWFKFVSIIWILITVLLTIFVFRQVEKWAYFLVVNLNFASFIFFFSKDKVEDEYSEQLRLKAFYYAFISFAVFSIMYGAIKGSHLEIPEFFGEYLFVQIFLGVALLTTIFYYYITKYKLFNKVGKV